MLDFLIVDFSAASAAIGWRNHRFAAAVPPPRIINLIAAVET